jgi:hypothetical protein
LGYNIPNSLAVEFDTYPWDAGGPNADHVSVQTGSTQTNSLDHKYSLGSTTSIPFLYDNKTHRAKVIYISGQLCVFVDDMQVPVLTVSVNLENTLSLTDGKAFIGFNRGHWSSYGDSRYSVMVVCFDCAIIMMDEG